MKQYRFDKKTELVDYPPEVETANFVTHLAAAAASVPAGVVMLRTALKSGDKTRAVSAAMFSAAMTAVYTVSSVYHGLKPGSAKASARRVDHMTVPLLIGGTAAPCSLVTLRAVSPARGRFVFLTSQAIVLSGALSKLFFFNSKAFKILTYVLYIGGGAAMLCQSLPVRKRVTKDGVRLLWIGSAMYLAGAGIMAAGRKYPALHPVFHVVTAAASAAHWGAIYKHIIRDKDDVTTLTTEI